MTRGYSSSTVTAIYGNDLSSRSRTLNGGRWRLTRFCSRCSASTSVSVTITSKSATRPGSWPLAARVSPFSQSLRTRGRAGKPRTAFPGRRRRVGALSPVWPSQSRVMPMTKVVLAAVLVAVLAGGAWALFLRPSYGHAIWVGALEDSVKQPDPAAADAGVALVSQAGFNALGMTTPWTPGQRQPEP